MQIKKQIVTNDNKEPVAVLIDYRDWQRIEKLLESSKTSEVDSLQKYAGTIHLTEDPLQYQERMRSEWN